MSPNLKKGLKFNLNYRVSKKSLVPILFNEINFTKDMPNVLATGYMVGMLELACTKSMIPYLNWPEEQSLGTHVNFSHLAATPLGMEIFIKGEVISVNGKKVNFWVEARDEIDKITEGEHERTVVIAKIFNEKLLKRKIL
tara:strand:+ start:2321 stop:2740 length:420 start_codon:yes stop_codon:yes gene_type:complete